MNFKNAIVRKPGISFADGITSGVLGKPDYLLALGQHAGYCQALESCNLVVTVLEADDHYPDSTFVEDDAVVTSAFAVVTRPGAPSRIGEIESLQPVLESQFEVVYAIQPPGTMDGGDICQADDHFIIGISERTNLDGAQQLSAIVQKHGYATSLVDCRKLPGLLHLKSGIAYLGEDCMLMVPELYAHPAFADYTKILVHPDEAYAANCVRINERLLIPKGFPGIQEILESRGYQTLTVEVSEFQKMDGGLSCLSLRY